MEIKRKYHKLSWWDLLDYFNEKLGQEHDDSLYIEFLDELHMRKLESVSEGGTFKIKAPANELFEKMQQKVKDEELLNQAKVLLDLILGEKV